MSSAKGLYSTKDNPMKQAKQVPVGISGGSNSDAQKANKLLKQAQAQQDSLRGRSGM